jgi:hypothetical protein
MTTFPLYDRLLSEIPKKTLIPKQKTELIKIIPTLDQNGQELIYALIKYHTIKEDSVSDEIPYGGTSTPSKKKNCEDITWNLGDFSSKLSLILYTFVQLHKKNQEEEVKRLKLLNKT